MSTRKPLVLGLGIVLMLVTICLVVLRFMIRRRRTTGLRPDDWLIALATLIGFMFTVCQCVATKYNLGMHIMNISPTSDPHFNTNKLIFLCAVFFGPCVSLTKLSITVVYNRRATSEIEKIFYLFIGIFFVCYGAASTFLQMLQCTPMRAYWDYNLLVKRCWEQGPLNIGLASVNNFTDAIVFFWPLRFLTEKPVTPLRRGVWIWQLALGILTFIVGVLRTWRYDVYSKSADPYYEQGTIFVTGAIQLWLGIITACIPILKPLFENPSILTEARPKSSHSIKSVKEVVQNKLRKVNLRNARQIAMHPRELVRRRRFDEKDQRLSIIRSVEFEIDSSSDVNVPSQTSKSKQGVRTKVTPIVIPPTPDDPEIGGEEVRPWSPTESEAARPKSGQLVGIPYETTRPKSGQLVAMPYGMMTVPSPPAPAAVNNLIKGSANFLEPIRRSISFTEFVNSEFGLKGSRASLMGLSRRNSSSSRKEDERKETMRSLGDGMQRRSEAPLPRMMSPTFYIQPGQSVEADLWVVNPVDVRRMTSQRPSEAGLAAPAAMAGNSGQGSSMTMNATPASELSTRQMITRTPSRASWSTAGSGQDRDLEMGSGSWPRR